MQQQINSSGILRHLNKLRWLVLALVFVVLILLPFIHLYQNYQAAHAYDLLTTTEKMIFDSMALLTSIFVNDVDQLNAFKGTTWSATVFNVKISDPLAVIAQMSTSLTLNWPFILSALIPILVTLVFGRIFCGWICPATFIYELNDNLAAWLAKIGVPIKRYHLDRRIKYWLLAIGILLSLSITTVGFASIYPPAIIGRELYYSIAVGGFGSGAIFFMLTLLFDLLVSQRGFCRYICPGGAVYSILGRFRLVRLKRKVSLCNDCAKCNVVCQFGLDPLHDSFGQECNNCSACIAICPSDALVFTLNIKDIPYQGAGHLGQHYKKTTY